MKGLLAFCDILGYQSFLENNQAEDAAMRVLDIITGTPEQIKSLVDIKVGSLEDTKVNSNIPEMVEYLIFSDTIVLMLPYPDEASRCWKMGALTYMSYYTSYLHHEMFKKGLPLRSVIHEGSFFKRESCLAGRGIVEAYQVSEQLNVSSVVFSDSLAAKMKKENANMKFDGSEDASHHFIEYLTPLKKGNQKKMIHFNWLRFSPKKGLEITDPVEFVLKSFWAHKKDCPISVNLKIEETSKLIRRFKILTSESSA